MSGFIQKILRPVCFLIFFSCAAGNEIIEQGEVLVLTNQTKIPCRILDFDGVDIYFHARKSADAYRYGELIPVGNVQAVHVTRGGRILSYAVMDYLDEKFPPDKSEIVQPQIVNAVEKSTVNLSKDEMTSEKNDTGLHINLRGFVADSLSQARAAQGIGLRLTERLKPEKTEIPVAYEELADLIVASGGTGLLLYRADKNREAGAELTEAQQYLLDAIQNSATWDERKKALRSAHKIASEAFAQIGKRELWQEFKFRAAAGSDRFIQFLIFLHKQGDLHSRVKFDRAAGFFGAEATGAISDILINFDDWYYIVVIQLAR